MSLERDNTMSAHSKVAATNGATPAKAKQAVQGRRRCWLGR